jgi:hypothetical protein
VALRPTLSDGLPFSSGQCFSLEKFFTFVKTGNCHAKMSHQDVIKRQVSQVSVFKEVMVTVGAGKRFSPANGISFDGQNCSLLPARGPSYTFIFPKI